MFEKRRSLLGVAVELGAVIAACGCYGRRYFGRNLGMDTGVHSSGQFKIGVMDVPRKEALVHGYNLEHEDGGMMINFQVKG
jgi:hypothetical protein